MNQIQISHPNTDNTAIAVPSSNRAEITCLSRSGCMKTPPIALRGGEAFVAIKMKGMPITTVVTASADVTRFWTVGEPIPRRL
jgi:hypothetical protein